MLGFSSASTEIATWVTSYDVDNIVIYGRDGNESIVKIVSTLLGTTDLIAENIRSHRFRIDVQDIVRRANQQEIDKYYNYQGR